MRGEKVANAICTRPEPGSSLRDGRHLPLSGSPGQTAMQLQISRVLSAASKALAAVCVNVEKLCETAPAEELEAQVRELRAARGKNINETDCAASPIAVVTGDRPVSSSAGQQVALAGAVPAISSLPESALLKLALSMLSRQQ